MGSAVILNCFECQEYFLSKFENSFGAIVADVLLISKDDTIISIRMEHLAKVSFHYRRNYFWNFVCFVSALLCVLTLIYIVTNVFWNIIICGIFSVTLILTLKMKLMEYTFLAVRFNLNFTEIKVKNYQKEDAEKIVQLINVKLKHRNESRS